MKTIKDGASTFGLSGAILIAWEIADEVYGELGIKFCTLTSGTDGTHGKSSRHYIGDAIDLRTREFPNGGNNSPFIDEAVLIIQKRLGNQYQVIRESNHLHLQFRPL